MKEQGKKVVLYCRLASRNKSGIKKQRLEMKRFCARQGWTIVAVYEDNGYSGLTNDRPGLKSMRRDAAKGKFSAVVIRDLSRLSRSYSDMMDLLCFFRAHRVVCLDSSENMERPRADDGGLLSLFLNRPVRLRVADPAAGERDASRHRPKSPDTGRPAAEGPAALPRGQRPRLQ
jgi:hypothetical protein